MDARPQKPAQVHPDSERVAVELQRNAPAVVEFEIEVTNRFVINARVILRVIAVGREGPMKKLCIQYRVADASVKERGEISERMIEMVRLVPSRVTDAKPFFLITGWRCHVHGGAVIQGFVGIIPP